MMKIWTVLLALGLAAGVTLAAQERSKERKVSDELRISSPIMIGGQMLQAGTYRIACNGTEVTFARASDEKKVLTLPCKGKDMGKKAEKTELHTILNENGVRVVDRLLIRGSHVEHVFN